MGHLADPKANEQLTFITNSGSKHTRTSADKQNARHTEKVLPAARITRHLVAHTVAGAEAGQEQGQDIHTHRSHIGWANKNKNGAINGHLLHANDDVHYHHRRPHESSFSCGSCYEIIDFCYGGKGEREEGECKGAGA